MIIKISRRVCLWAVEKPFDFLVHRGGLIPSMTREGAPTYGKVGGPQTDPPHIPQRCTCRIRRRASGGDGPRGQGRSGFSIQPRPRGERPHPRQPPRHVLVLPRDPRQALQSSFPGASSVAGTDLPRALEAPLLARIIRRRALVRPSKHERTAPDPRCQQPGGPWPPLRYDLGAARAVGEGAWVLGPTIAAATTSRHRNESPVASLKAQADRPRSPPSRAEGAPARLPRRAPIRLGPGGPLCPLLPRPHVGVNARRRVHRVRADRPRIAAVNVSARSGAPLKAQTGRPRSPLSAAGVAGSPDAPLAAPTSDGVPRRALAAATTCCRAPARPSKHDRIAP